jgi:hypothetical protein
MEQGLTANIHEWVVVKCEFLTIVGIPIDAYNGYNEHLSGNPLGAHRAFLEGRPITLKNAFELRTPDRARNAPGDRPLLQRDPMPLPIDFAFQGAVITVRPTAFYACNDLHPVDRAFYSRLIAHHLEQAARALASASVGSPGDGLPVVKTHGQDT